jgi:hypothetical protein
MLVGAPAASTSRAAPGLMRAAAFDSALALSQSAAHQSWRKAAACHHEVKRAAAAG